MKTQTLPTSPQHLLTLLDTLSVSYTLHHHVAVHSVEDATDVDQQVEATGCRNLFLRDKKKKMFLLTVQNDTAIDLKKLEKRLSCGRLSFGSAERLFDNLGVRPGSVCPFSIMNDKDHNVTLILEEDMMRQDKVAYHPMQNTMTVALTPQDLIKFLDHINHPYEIIDLKTVRPE